MSEVISKATWRDYYQLTKPNVVALMILTAVVGMHMATRSWVPLPILFFATLGIALAAASAAAINQLLDRSIDSMMARTQRRPLVRGNIKPFNAAMFALVLGLLGMFVLVVYVNTMTAVLTFLTLLGYAGIYTLYLKRATAQNIVIGGLAGATPPLLGYTAVTGVFMPESLLLVLIIYTWTPPHFWALAIYRFDDYKKAEIPMLPVTHGIAFTKLCILLYTVLLIAVSLLPYLIGMSGWPYALSALLLGLRFLQWAWRLYFTQQAKVAMQMFRFSIVYLMLLFVALLVDHYLIF